MSKVNFLVISRPDKFGHGSGCGQTGNVNDGDCCVERQGCGGSSGFNGDGFCFGDGGGDDNGCRTFSGNGGSGGAHCSSCDIRMDRDTGVDG